MQVPIKGNKLREADAKMDTVRVLSTENLPRDEWLAVRRRGIGGSDIGAIAGLHPYKSPMHVWLDKVGLMPETPESEAAHWGRKLETVVAEEFAERHPELRVERVSCILQHPVQPLFLANPDRLVIAPDGSEAVLEIKTASQYLYGSWSEDNLPDYVAAQVYWYLLVTGLETAHVAALIGGNHYQEYRVERNETILGHLQRIALDFWALVESQTPPPVDGSDAAAELMSALYPSANDSEIILPLEADDWVKRYLQARKDEQDAANRKQEAANRLKQMLGPNAAGRCGRYRVTWKNITSKRLDTKALKMSRPEIWEHYAVETTTRTFDVREKEVSRNE